MKTSILFSLLLLFISSTAIRAQQTMPAKEHSQKQSTATLSHKIIDSADKTFGYDIYSDGRLLVHQPSIPGKPGNKGFKTKAAAEKTAKFVMEKIKKGEMPPTVTDKELETLKVL